MAQVTTLRQEQIAPKAPKPEGHRNVLAKKPKASRKLNRQALMASGLGLAAGALICLSLDDLAKGIAEVTNISDWHAWAMAIGVDFGFVMLELSQLTMTDKLRKQLSRYSNPAIIGTLMGSACLNALAFAGGAHGMIMQSAAVVMGVAIPAIVYALTRVSVGMLVDCHDKR